MLPLSAAETFPAVNMSCIDSVIFSCGSTRKEAQKPKTKVALNAAKELLKNGILVETNKGLVCMSLRDALSKGVGGHNLSVEDFQTVATKLLFQEEPDQMVAPENLTLDTDSFSNFKFEYKLLNKANFSSSKVPYISSALAKSTCCTSQVDLKGLKDPLESGCYYSHEYSVLNNDESQANHNREVILSKELTSEIDDVIPKKSLVNKRSLIIKNDVKPVIPVQGMIKNEMKPETNVLESVLIKTSSKLTGLLQESYVSCEETSDNSEVTSVVNDKVENKLVKKRGGWPKGRKRKPEIKYEIRPPKAPATGYVIFLNEKRKDYRDMPFTEVTKLLGNEWSKLSLQEKKVYLEQAEVEKKRYREELKAYRQSDAYQNYLQKKRLKRLQGHGTEESDMDATDEIDEEDNEELYCRSCDQWFHSLHNKKEHLYGRQHLQSIAVRYTKLSDPDWCNANMSSTSLDESSLDGSSYLKGSKDHCCNGNRDSLNMDDVIVKFMVANKEREEERSVLRKKLEESKARNQILSQEVQKLNERLDSLTCMVESERNTQILLEQRLFNLLNVPTLFYLPEPLSEDN